jgi:hypothetical protein
VCTLYSLVAMADPAVFAWIGVGFAIVGMGFAVVLALLLLKGLRLGWGFLRAYEKKEREEKNDAQS